MDMGEACKECGFGLFIPLATFAVSSLGLYSDSRFPGRSILSLNHHYEDMVDVPEDILNSFMNDAREAMVAIKKATGCARVNFAILGNRESHVHAHLIPRYPENEEFPDCSPWNDKRNKEELSFDFITSFKSKFAVMH